MTGPSTLKGGNLILRAVDAPESVSPGQSVTVRVDVSNGAFYIGLMDPDRCMPDILDRPGYETEIRLDGPSGVSESVTRCIPMTELGTRDITERFTFTAPEEPGDYEISAAMHLPGSSKTSAPVRATLTVSSDAPAQAPEDDTSGSPGGIDLPDAPSPSDAGGLFDDKVALALATVLLLAVAWLASSASTTAQTAGRVLA